MYYAEKRLLHEWKYIGEKKIALSRKNVVSKPAT